MVCHASTRLELQITALFHQIVWLGLKSCKRHIPWWLNKNHDMVIMIRVCTISIVYENPNKIASTIKAECYDWDG